MRRKSLIPCIALAVLISACDAREQNASVWDAPIPTQTPAPTTRIEPAHTASPHGSREESAHVTSTVNSVLATSQPTLFPRPAHVRATSTKGPRQIEQGFVPPPTIPFMPGHERTEFGAQLNVCDHGVEASLPIVKQMGLTWVKLQVRWGDMQQSADVIDWTCLDTAIPAINRARLKMLASVVTAPTIYRKLTKGVHGPPNDLDQYSAFLYKLISRYPKQIHAIEVWNEPNLSREWDWQIDGAVYRHLLAMAYGVIKWLDPDIMVISAGLAETELAGIWQHVDPDSFVRKFRRYNGDAYADCVGAHANGPDGPGDIQTVVPNLFALFELRKPICVTEFGYGLPVENQAPEGFDWIMRHTEAEQSRVLVNGLDWARKNRNVRLVILWSLDYWGPPTDPNAPYALVRPDWMSPAIQAIASYLTR